jgi:IclR family transcriptional regulator, acetate operon repressor
LKDSGTGTLGKLMQVLDHIAAADVPLRFSDLLECTGEPRGTLHRHLTHLVDEGLAETDADGRYRPGLRLLSLAARTWASNDLRRVARPHIEVLQQITGETVHLGVLRDKEIIYLDKVEGTQSLRLHSQVGNTSPVYCTGVGKAALSTLDDVQFELILARIEFKFYTCATITDPETFRAAIQEARQTGFAYDLEEHEAGICCIAAPFSSRGGLNGGVSITAPSFRAGLEVMEKWKPALAATVAAVCKDLDIRMSPK